MRELKTIEKKLGIQLKALHQVIALLDDKPSLKTAMDTLKEQIKILSDTPSENEKLETEGKLQKLEFALVHRLVQKHLDVLGQAEKLDITWLNRRITQANMALDKSEDTISALDFIKQAQKIHQYASAIKELDNYCKDINANNPIVIDLTQLKQSDHFRSHLYKKLTNHIHAPEIGSISELAKNKLVPEKAITLLHQTLYDLDIKHNKEDRLYFHEMVELIKFYCQEMKKDYAKDSPKRYKDGIVNLLTEYRKHRGDLTTEDLKILRTNMSYTGLGSLGVVIFNIKNSYQHPSEQIIEPNNGQIALARAIGIHSKKFNHHCAHHEEEKSLAWEKLKGTSNTSEEVKVLRELADNVRQQHRSESRFFTRSELAEQIEQEGDHLETALKKAQP